MVVVSNLSDQRRSGYAIGLPPGRWQEVLCTDSERYGDFNDGNAGAVMKGRDGLTLPPGATIVLKKVG